MKSKGMILVVMACFILGGITYFLVRGQQRPPKEEQSVVAPIEESAGQSIEAFGLVKATEVMNINIEFPARVSQFFVKEGERVSLGQTLLSLDVDEYLSEIRSTEYELQLASYERRTEEKDLALLIKEIEEKEEQLETSTDYELSKAWSDLINAQDELEKKEELLAVEAISVWEVEELRKKVSDQILYFDHLVYEKVEEIKRLKTELSLKQRTEPENEERPDQYLTSINMKRQKISLLEQRLGMLQNKLNQSFIRNNEIISNIENGVVCEIGYAEGDLLSVEKKVLSIIDLDSMIVEAHVAEEFIKDVQLGAEVLITPVADYSRSYKGRVIRLSNLAIKDNGETVVPVEISIDDRDDFLLPNFNVDVTIFNPQ